MLVILQFYTTHTTRKRHTTTPGTTTLCIPYSFSTVTVLLERLLFPSQPHTHTHFTGKRCNIQDLQRNINIQKRSNLNFDNLVYKLGSQTPVFK